MFFATFSLFGVVGAGVAWRPELCCAAQKEVVKIKHNTHLQLSGKATKKQHKIKQNTSKQGTEKTTKTEQKKTSKKNNYTKICGR